MNEIECETCIKRKTVYCPNHVDCYDTINKPYYQNRIMLLEENKQLKELLESNSKVNIADHMYASECEDKLINVKHKQQELKYYLKEQIEKCDEYIKSHKEEISGVVNINENNRHLILIKRFMMEKEIYEEILSKIEKE